MTQDKNELLTILRNFKILKNCKKKSYLFFLTIIFLKLLYVYRVQIFHDFYRSPCSGRDGVVTLGQFALLKVVQALKKILFFVCFCK